MFWKLKLYEFTLDKQAPLTFQHPQGFYIQPDAHVITDYGTIPPPVQTVTGVTGKKYPLSFVFHDSVCRHWGLYFSRTPKGPYTFVAINSQEAHDMLQLMVLCEGRGTRDAIRDSEVVRRGVMWFGPDWQVKHYSGKPGDVQMKELGTDEDS